MSTYRQRVALAAIFGLGSSALLGAAAPVQDAGPAHSAIHRSVTSLPADAGLETGYCDGVEPVWPDPNALCGDGRLGPEKLPDTGHLAKLLKGYDRLGGEKTPKAFLDKYWDNDKKTWKYPPADGFVTDKDGKGKFVTKNLPKGVALSRFGGESGNYLALADAHYSKRSLPPSNLSDPRDKEKYVDGCPNNFHLYEVIQPITGEEGFLAPAFGQPGLGAQYFSKSGGLIWSVEEFVNRGYLKRLNCESKR